MQNILLGKVVKAMYKLSGKTLQQLADETGLTVDTLNNLFYARLQKPGFFGVEAVVEATGYTVEDLLGFMKIAETLPADADVTEAFAEYIFTAKETKPVVDSAVNCGKHTDGSVSADSCCMQIKTLNEEHEKELDRFRATHLHYVDELHARYQEQIRQMESSSQRIEEHYNRSIAEIKKSHDREVDDYQKEMKRAQSINRLLTVALIAVALVAGIVILIIK